MNQKKYWVLFFYFLSLGIFLLLIADTYLVFKKDYGDSIDHFSRFETKTPASRSRVRAWSTPVLHTVSGEKILLPENVTMHRCDSCSLQINRGFFFGNPVTVRIRSKDKAYAYNTAFLSRTFGSKLLTVAISLLLVIGGMQLLWRKRANIYLAGTAFFGTLYLLVYSI